MLGSALLVYSVLVLCASAEDVVRCDSESASYTVVEGTPVRVTSKDYPNALNLTHHQCAITFLAPSKQLQIIFINGLLDEGQEAILYGVTGDTGNGTAVRLNTALSYGADFNKYTYVASDNLTLVLPFFYFHYWFGFEAIVSIYDGSPKCGDNEVIDLAPANGPVEFGTPLHDESASSSVCSWMVQATRTQPVKVVVKYGTIFENETVSLVDQPNGAHQQQYTGNAPQTFYFPDGGPVRVIYNRSSGPPDHGVYLQASVYETKTAECSLPGTGLVKLGKEQSSFSIENFGSRMENETGSFATPYLPNQACTWSFLNDLSYELHVIAMKTFTETGSDYLTLKSDELTQLETLDSFSDQHFVFSRDNQSMLNITWISDGNLALQGVSIWVHARECVCAFSKVQLTLDEPIVEIYSFTDVEFCNNIHCTHEVTAPAGTIFVLLADVTLRNILEDSFTVSDGTTVQFSMNGTDATLTRSAEIYSFTGYMEINLYAGEVWRYHSNEMAGTWSGTLRLFSENQTVTTLTALYPAVYKSSELVSKWTIVATEHVELLLLSGPADGINWFDIKDADGNVVGGFNDCLNVTEPFVSTGSSVSIERTDFEGRTDFAIYARDSASDSSACDPVVVQLLGATWNFQVDAPADRSCFFTLDDASGTIDSDHFVMLSDIVYANAPTTDPIRILAGAFRTGDYDSTLVASLDSGNADVAWNYIEIHNRLATFILPKGSFINATAFRHAADELDRPRKVWCGQSGTISSREYGQENRQYTAEMLEEVLLSAGRTQIQLELTAFFGENDVLVISASDSGFKTTYSNTNLTKEVLTLTSTGFKVDYTPSATGEKGFLIKYTFGDCNAVTTAAPPQPFDYEDFVRCDEFSNETIGFESDLQPLRIIARDYPYATVGTQPSCYVHLTAPGMKMKIEFVNAYLEEGQEVTIYDVDVGATELYNVTTTMNTGLMEHFTEYTYYVHDDAVIEMPEFYANSWYGFEALVTIVHDEINCYNGYVIDLEYFNGPVEFGTNWKNRTDGAEELLVCSWRLKVHGGFGYTIKVRVLKVNLRVGESFYFVDQKKWPIPYVEGNNSYIFYDQDYIDVVYNRTGGDSTDYGIYLQASNAYTKYPASSDECIRPTDGVRTLGLNTSTAFVSNVVDYLNGTMRQYLDNQMCNWAFNVEPHYELRAIVRKLVVEECCDKLTLSYNDSTGGDSFTLNSDSDLVYIFDRDTNVEVFFDWLSDSSVSLAGFNINLDVTNCTCDYDYVSLSLSNPVQFLSSYKTGYSYCNDIQCVNEIVGPKGFDIVLHVDGRLRDSPDEYLMAEDVDESVSNIDPLFMLNGSLVREPFDLHVFSYNNYIKVTLNSGTLNRLHDEGEIGYWNGIATLIKAYKSTQTLSASKPMIYKSSAEVGNWTIRGTAPGMQLVAFSSDEDALKVYTLYDGNQNYSFDKLFYPNATLFVSQSNTLTVLRNDWTVKSDFVIIVKDPTATGTSCSPTFLFDTNAFSVDTTSTSAPCALTMVHNTEYFGIDHSITLRNLSIELANEELPLTIISGPYTRANDSNILLELNGASVNEKWLDREFEFHDRVITLLVPANAKVAGDAFAMIEPKSNKNLSLGEQSTFSSRDFGFPNYRFDAVELYSANCTAGNVEIDIALHFEFQLGGTLIIATIPGGDEVTFPADDESDMRGDATLNLTGSGFTLHYEPSANGELGFFMKFAFGTEVLPWSNETSTSSSALTTSTTSTTTITLPPTSTTAPTTTTLPTSTTTKAPDTTTTTSTTTTATSTTTTTTSTTSVATQSTGTTTTIVTSTTGSTTMTAATSTESSEDRGGVAGVKPAAVGLYVGQLSLVSLLYTWFA